MEGWVKLYRKILENPIVCKDSDYFSVWCYLLLNATHSEYDVIFNNERITLKPGQLITGRKKISDKFKINQSKVQRILKTLENEQQIEQQTCNSNRLISILQWELYQESEQQIEQRVNNERTTSEQRVNTNKNVNNIKNDNNVEENIYTQEKEIFDYWNSKEGVIHSQERSFNKNKISTAIKTYGKDNILKAIDRLNNGVLNPNYYYNFKWNIFKFFKQSNGISNWLDDGQLWNDYKNKEVGNAKDAKHKQDSGKNSSKSETISEGDLLFQRAIEKYGDKLDDFECDF